MNIKRKSLINLSAWWRSIAIFYIVVLLYISVVNAISPETVDAVIRTKAGARHYVAIEIASTHLQKVKGLSHRRAICANCGMLFVYDSPQKLSFWMKDTLIPLDIAFLNQNMSIIEIVRNMEPFSLESVVSKNPSQYALEMPHNYFDDNNIKVKDRLIIHHNINVD